MTDAVLGIDVSKNTFDTNLGAGTKARSKSFANSPAGWHQLIAWLGEHKIGQVHACLEATGRHGLGIALALHEAGHVVSVVNPAQIRDFARTKLGRNKTDQVDAVHIREYAELFKPRPWTPPSPAMRRLCELQTIRAGTVAGLTEWKNRHHSGIMDDLALSLAKTTPCGSPKLAMPCSSNKNRLLVNIHGGGYVYNPGEAASLEATLMAGYGGFKVISVDYRMPPDYPFPAGLDDAMRVWRAALKMHDPRNMAIFGSSAGAGMVVAMMLRAKAEGLSLPAALGAGTPWANLTESGDTSKTNEWLDNVLVNYSGYLGRAARLYANGRPLTDPLLSPIFGDFRNFPPTILTSGTRDLLLSLTVLTHRKLRQAGVEAYLQVFEGMSHFQFILDTEAPESNEAFTEIAGFFDRHLGT